MSMYIDGYSHTSIRPLSREGQAARDTWLRQGFDSSKALSEERLSLAEATAKPEGLAPEEITRTAAPRTVEYYTGYARIDNAIADALAGKSTELKTGVYEIIRKDFLRQDVRGLSEEDRQAQIRLGLEKAQELAEQFLTAPEKTSFLEAMRSVAAIGMRGQRTGDGGMEYEIHRTIGLDGQGHVRENLLDEALFSLQKESPEDYRTYQNLLRLSDHGHSAALFALRFALGHMDLIQNNRTAYQQQQEEAYRELLSTLA